MNGSAPQIVEPGKVCGLFGIVACFYKTVPQMWLFQPF